MLNMLIYTFIFISLLACAYFFYLKDFWRSRKILRQNFPESYELLLTKVFHPYIHLTPLQKVALQYKILYFLKYKNFWGIREFEVNEDMKLIIAAQACLLVLKDKSVITYPHLTNIYISSGPYIEKENPIDQRTMLPTYSARLGESWMRGPLLLSWESVASDLKNVTGKNNIVYHEFSHQLDSLDGGMDGTPILDVNKDYRTWQIVMSKNFLKLRQKVIHHKKTDIDSYGATNEAEFFAVTVEQFFSDPYLFQKRNPDIYQLYKHYFELDPLQWQTG